MKLAYENSFVADAQPPYAATLATPGVERGGRTAPHGFWLRGYGGKGRLDGASGAGDATFDHSGVVAGENLRLGVLLSYAKPKLAQGAPENSAEVQSRQVGLYGRYRDGNLRLDGVATDARNQTDS